MIERTVFNRQMAIIAEIHRYVVSGPTIDEYYALLSPRMTTAQFVTIARRLEVSGSFWPKPAEFIPPVAERLGVDALDEAAHLEGLSPGVREPVLLPGSVRTGKMDNRGKLVQPKEIASKIGDIMPSVLPTREGAA